MNRFMITGHAVRQPELRTTSKGTKFCTLTVAVRRAGKKVEGQPDADFFNVSVWGKQAESCVNIQKGYAVIVEAHLRNNSYEKNGQKVFTNDIVADNVDWSLNSRSQSQNSQEHQSQSQHPTQSSYNEVDASMIPDSSMPF